MQPDPAAPEFQNHLAKIVQEILDAKHGDRFESACALVGVAYCLACEDAAYRVVLARHLVNTARELDPDCCEAIRWQ
jgi:hypothetical protein